MLFHLECTACKMFYNGKKYTNVNFPVNDISR